MLTGKAPHESSYGNANQLPSFLFKLGTEKLSYNPKELVPNASNSMQQFLSMLLLYEIHKRLSDAVEARVVFREEVIKKL